MTVLNQTKTGVPCVGAFDQGGLSFEIPWHASRKSAVYGAYSVRRPLSLLGALWIRARHCGSSGGEVGVDVKRVGMYRVDLATIKSLRAHCFSHESKYARRSLCGSWVRLSHAQRLPQHDGVGPRTGRVARSFEGSDARIFGISTCSDSARAN